MFYKIILHVLGTFVSVKGTVVRVSNIKPKCIQLAFECTTCTCIQVVAALAIHTALFVFD